MKDVLDHNKVPVVRGLFVGVGEGRGRMGVLPDARLQVGFGLTPFVLARGQEARLTDADAKLAMAIRTLEDQGLAFCVARLVE